MGFFFISYQHDSKRFARTLKKNLEEYQILCWIDDNIRYGDKWKNLIDTEIENSSGVIVIVTLAAMRSSYVTYEWSYAMGLGKKVIPVILEMPELTDIHPKLTDLQRHNFDDLRSHKWKKLADELRNILSQEDIPKNIRDAEDAINSYDIEIRKRGTLFLLGHSNRIVLEVFARAAQSESPEVAVNAGLALAQKSEYPDDRAIVGLEKGIKEDYPQLDNVLNALVAMNSDAAIACIERKFLEAHLGKSQRLLRKLADAAAQFSNRKIIPVIQDMIRDMEGLQTLLVNALCNFADPDTLPELLAIANRSNIPSKPRAMAIQTIGKIGFPETIEAIFEIVNSLKRLHYQDDFEIFDASLEAFKAIGGQTALDKAQRINGDGRFSARYQEIRRAIQFIQSGIK